jgi:hypothetical protein
LNILLSKILKLVVTGDGFLKGGNLILRNVAGNVLTVFPALVIVVGAFGSFSEDAELAAFHVLDLSDLLKEKLRSEIRIHECSISPAIYCLQQKKQQN